MQTQSFMMAFLSRHNTELQAAGVVISTTLASLLVRNQAELDKFLKEHNLYTEYYTFN